MPRRTLLTFAGWLAAALTATAIGIGALRLVDFTGGGGDVLTPQQVSDLLAAASPAPSPAQPTAAPSSTPDLSPSAPRSLSGPGGSVVAVCVGGQAFLRTWTPAQGYGVERVERGPYEHADVRFEGSAGRSEVRVRCVNGEPTADWTD
jgi:hypothetical protein